LSDGTVEKDGTEYIFEPEDLETEEDEGGKVIWPPQEGENQ
jgi:hypothetical protein